MTFKSLKKEFKIKISTAIGSYFAIVLASLICGIELSLAGAVPIGIAIPAIVYWHLFIGISETTISAVIIFYIYEVKTGFITIEPLMIKKVIKINISKY